MGSFQPNIRNLNAIGTDQDMAIYRGFAAQIPDLKLLLCAYLSIFESEFQFANRNFSNKIAVSIFEPEFQFANPNFSNKIAVSIFNPIFNVWIQLKVKVKVSIRKLENQRDWEPKKSVFNRYERKILLQVWQRVLPNGIILPKLWIR